MTNREHLIRLIEDACRGCARYKAEDIADNLISEGMVSVVRCKECKHYKGEQYNCWLMRAKMKPDDFCSYGERSNENAE